MMRWLVACCVVAGCGRIGFDEPPGVETSSAPRACGESCIAAGGQCFGGTCVIECTTRVCADVVCPPGIPCTVSCGLGSCSSIDCSAASECTLSCIGAGSCAGDVVCGGSTCALSCTGPGSCMGAVDCIADHCSVTCDPYAGCQPQP